MHFIDDDMANSIQSLEFSAIHNAREMTETNSTLAFQLSTRPQRP